MPLHPVRERRHKDNSLLDCALEVLAQKRPVEAVIDWLCAKRQLLAHQVEQRCQSCDRGRDEVALDARDGGLARTCAGCELPLGETVAAPDLAQKRAGRHAASISFLTSAFAADAVAVAVEAVRVGADHAEAGAGTSAQSMSGGGDGMHKSGYDGSHSLARGAAHFVR